MKLFTWFFTLVISIFLTGCATSLKGDVDPQVDMNKFQVFYVQRQPKDDNGIERIIAEQLEQNGKIATYGDEAQSSEEVDAVVTYIDKWMWDITMYLLELTVEVRDPDTGYIFAKGHSYRTSLVRKSPEGMVEEVLGTIFVNKESSENAN